jgi:hypothetical protein
MSLEFRPLCLVCSSALNTIESDAAQTGGPASGETSCSHCGERYSYDVYPDRLFLKRFAVPAGDTSPKETTIYPDPLQATDVKQRHGCLTAFLVFAIAMNSIVAIIFGFFADALFGIELPVWSRLFTFVVSVFVVACYAMLFQWKKWAFFGIVAATVVCSAIALLTGNIIGMIPPFIPLAILYGVLQIGGDKKGWTQLE